MERPVQAKERLGRKNRLITQKRDAERNKSSEACQPCAKKSRYCIYDTRTVNRHRWMRRES